MDTVLAKRRRSAAIARASKKTRKPAKSSLKAIESIKPDEMYPVELVPQKFGVGRSTIRNAERDGMKVCKFGLRKFVSGSELIRFMSGKKS